jgi:SCP-2 sterol transfer family
MRFLSEEHFATANAAFRADAVLQASLTDVTLAIVYVVSAGPDGEFTYHIRVADCVASMNVGDLSERDAEVRSSYDTAAKMSRGELANQTAVMLGKLRIKGGMMTLLRHQGVLNRIQAISSAIPVTY